MESTDQFPSSSDEPQSEDGGAVEDLIAAIARREVDGFSALFRLAAPRLKASLIERRQSPEIAETLAIEVMLIVWRDARTFDPRRETAWGWIFTLLRRHAMRELPHIDKDWS